MGDADCHSPSGFAMTAVVAPWSRFAEDAVVIPEYTAERSMPVPYIWVSKLFVPIRRAETSDRSGGFTRLSSSKIHQARVWPPALPGDRSGGFRSPYGSHNPAGPNLPRAKPGTPSGS